MNDNDLQKIADLVDQRINKALTPVKEDLSQVKKTLSNVKDTQDKIKNSQDKMKRTLDEVKETQDNRVLHSVTETEVTIKSYADSYKINQHNIERVDTRLTNVEENLGIEPHQDLKVPYFSSK